MLSIIWYVRHGLRPLRNERGAETAEWMIIVGLLAAVGIFIYASPDGPLALGLKDLIDTIIKAVKAAFP
ncbi:MAG: hypothetical protein ACREJ1_00100 [Candidatus Methylomirabilales bacterium]